MNFKNVLAVATLAALPVIAAAPSLTVWRGTPLAWPLIGSSSSPVTTDCRNSSSLSAP